jgi:hypothetical protein
MIELLWEDSPVQPGGRFSAHVGTFGKLGIIRFDDDGSWHAYNLPIVGHVSDRVALKARTADEAKAEATQLAAATLLEVRRRIDLALAECGA